MSYNTLGSEKNHQIDWKQKQRTPRIKQKTQKGNREIEGILIETI